MTDLNALHSLFDSAMEGCKGIVASARGLVDESGSREMTVLNTVSDMLAVQAMIRWPAASPDLAFRAHCGFKRLALGYLQDRPAIQFEVFRTGEATTPEFRATIVSDMTPEQALESLREAGVAVEQGFEGCWPAKCPHCGADWCDSHEPPHVWWDHDGRCSDCGHHPFSACDADLHDAQGQRPRVGVADPQRDAQAWDPPKAWDALLDLVSESGRVSLQKVHGGWTCDAGHQNPDGTPKIYFAESPHAALAACAEDAS